MAKRSSLRGLLGTVVLCAAAGSAIGACRAVGPAGHPPPPAATGGAGGAGAGGGGGSGGSMFLDDAGSDGPPAPDAGGLCGNQIHQVLGNAPNLYFLFDVSGSMSEPAGGGYTRYQLVQHSAVQMIETLGSLINVGAAVLPKGATDADACHVGGEVFPVSPGDPVMPSTGPTTGGFIAATSLEPAGGTPTAATLNAIRPGLIAIGGVTVVLFATDGGPNCDAALTCTADQCIPNIEGDCEPPTSNCCAPTGTAGPEGCLDHDASVSAVAAIASAGIPVFIIGIPGSETYASLLDDMAVAGGVPQSGMPSYYAVDDLGGLEQVFQTIASGFVSCKYVLTDPPPDEGHTNVYFDQNVIPADPVNGWVWVSPSEIELVGAACAELKSGTVQQVQIVSGCPTQEPQ